MGNFCSSKQESYYLHQQDRFHSPAFPSEENGRSPFHSLGHLPLSLHQLASSPLSSSSSPSLLHGAGPVTVPSLFDLCLQQLCLSLLDSSSMSEISRRRSDIRMTDEQLFLLQHWMRTQLDRAGAAHAASRDRNTRSRSLSLSSKESPELLPQPALPPHHQLAFIAHQLLLPQPHLLPAQSLPPLVSKGVRYTASSRSLSAAQSVQRRSSLSASASVALPASSSPSPREALILYAMQQQSSASTPTSPLHRVRGFEDNEMDVPMLQQHQTAAVSAARSVSSYAGSAAQWVWEKGRRRSWFAGSSAQQSGSSTSPSPSASSSASQSAFAFVPPLQSLAFPAPNRLRLPDSLIELIFHRLVSQRLLTLSTLHLFWCAPLTRIDLAEYEGVTDAWLELLLMGWMVDKRGAVAGLGLGAGGKRGGKDEERGWGRSGERSDELEAEGGQQDEEDDVLEEDETDSEDADGDDTAKEEEEKTLADSSYNAASPTAAMDIEVKTDVLSSPTVPLLDDSWSLSSSPAFTPRLTTCRPLIASSGSSVVTTRSSSLSSTPQQPPALSTSPVIKPITFSSLQPPSASSPVHAAAPPPLSLRYLDLSKCDLITDRPLYSLVYAPLLSHLALDGCTQISDSLLCAVLPLLPSLLSLSLNNCHAVSDVSLSALREAHRLHHLLLDCTAITNAGLLSLSHLTRLRTLSVGCNGNRVTDAGLCWLPQCFSLRSLSVCHTGVQDMSLYRSLQRLRQLDISGTKLSSSAAAAGIASLRVESLIMQSCDVKEIPAVFIHHGLRLLDVGFSKMSGGRLASGLAALARSRAEEEGRGREQEAKEREEMDDDDDDDDGIATCYEMDQAVSVSPSPSPSPPARPLATPHSAPLLPLSSSSASSLPPSLSLACAGPLLHTLNLESSEADNRLLPVLSSFPCLTSLNLCDTNVDQDGLLHLSALSSLQALNLSGNRINNSSLSFLSGLCCLTSLQLDCSNITDAGLTHLQPLTGLTSLDLFESSITDAGVAHLTPLTALSSLEICSTKLTNAAVATIASSLPCLSSLNLARNAAITDAAVPLLSQLRRLRHLNLSHSGITVRGLEAFSGCVGLRTLSLFGCKVRMDGKDERVKALLPLGLQVGLDQYVIAAVEDDTRPDARDDRTPTAAAAGSRR